MTRRALVLGACVLGTLVFAALVFGAAGWRTPPTLSERETMAVQRTAVLTLFVEREHPRRLVFWNDGAHLSPTLRLLREAGVALDAQLPDTAALALPLPVHLETLATMEQQFRASPDGWEVWFKRFPASSGLIALTRPVRLMVPADGIERVRVMVARTCGEHCHSAWRMTLQRATGGGWRTLTVQPLSVPRD
jgi:hypothetical protein